MPATAFVQGDSAGTYNSGGVTSQAVTFRTNVTAHNVMFASLLLYGWSVAGTASVSGGGTWVQVGGLQAFQTNGFMGLFVCLNATGGATTVTASISGGTGINVNFSVQVAEFSNMTSPAQDGHSSASGVGVTSSGNFSTATDGDLIYCAMIAGSTGATAGAGFAIGNPRTNPALNSNLIDEWMIQGTHGTTAGTWGNQSANAAIFAVAITGASSAAAAAKSGWFIPPFFLGSKSG
jgi:hypothetical protein